MKALSPRVLARWAALAIVLLTGPLARPAAAQERPAALAGELAGGVLYFTDNEVVREGFFGAAARFYMKPKVSFGPEMAYAVYDNHSHLMLTANLTFDLLSPVLGKPRTVTPFLVGGGGMFQTYETTHVGDFTHTEGSFTAGGGMRVFLPKRIYLGVEARVGWELHVRLNGILGMNFGK
jgi:hypothetical protein